MVLEQKRLALHKKLCEILDSKFCYFSPPTGTKMKYPCIVYKLGEPNIISADNIPYLVEFKWDLTVIDEDPDSEIAQKLIETPKCRLGRPFAVDDLNHFPFTLYY